MPMEKLWLSGSEMGKSMLVLGVIGDMYNAEIRVGVLTLGTYADVKSRNV